LPKYSQSIVLFENEKRKYNVSITAIKQKWLLSAVLLSSNSYRLSGIYVILMNCFGTRKALFSWRVMLMEKGYATFVRDAVTKRNRCK
jgi:hypothetical protein